MKKREERIGFEIRRLDHMLARNVQARVKAAGLDEVTPCRRYFPERHRTALFHREIHRHEHHSVDGEKGIRP